MYVSRLIFVHYNERICFTFSFFFSFNERRRLKNVNGCIHTHTYIYIYKGPYQYWFDGDGVNGNSRANRREFRRADFKRLCIVVEGWGEGAYLSTSFSKRFQTYLRMKRMLTRRLALLSVTGKDIEGWATRAQPSDRSLTYLLASRTLSRRILKIQRSLEHRICFLPFPFNLDQK